MVKSSSGQIDDDNNISQSTSDDQLQEASGGGLSGIVKGGGKIFKGSTAGKSFEVAGDVRSMSFTGEGAGKLAADAASIAKPGGGAAKSSSIGGKLGKAGLFGLSAGGAIYGADKFTDGTDEKVSDYLDSQDTE